jgi:mannose-6-phosphate isomerase
MADEIRIDKPWGHELIVHHTENYVVKELHVLSGKRLSLQYHQQKEETMILLSGKAILDVPTGSIIMSKMYPIYLFPKTIHRLTSIEDCVVIEVSTPELDDVVRLEDDYGR